MLKCYVCGKEVEHGRRAAVEAQTNREKDAYRDVCEECFHTRLEPSPSGEKGLFSVVAPKEWVSLESRCADLNDIIIEITEESEQLKKKLLDVSAPAVLVEERDRFCGFLVQILGIIHPKTRREYPGFFEKVDAALR